MPGVASKPLNPNGKDGRFPKIRSGGGSSDEASVDINILDYDVEAFLSRLKKSSDGNSSHLWKDLVKVVYQLKASRELLSIGSHLFSNKTKVNFVDRLIESTHIILNAERVYVFEIDPTGRSLVLTHTKDKNVIGSKIPIEIGIEGNLDFVVVFHFLVLANEF